MNLYHAIRIAACATCIASASAASTVNEAFSSFWVLGDSLSAYIGEPGGDTTRRASDGPLWSEQIVNDFRDAGQEAESFAVGSATAGLQRPNPVDPTIPFDLTSQVDRLLQETARFGSKPIVSVWIGGNDIGAFAQGLPVSESISAYSSALGRIIGAGVTDLLLFEVPDVGFTPLIQDPRSPLDPTDASNATAALNTAFFDLVVAGLPAAVDVKRINTFDLTRTAFVDPGFFGAAATGPCTVSGQTLADCTQTTFWDPFHPTALLHDFVANEVRAAGVAPVPLPAAGWMLLSAIAGILVIKRRRRVALA